MLGVLLFLCYDKKVWRENRQTKEMGKLGYNTRNRNVLFASLHNNVAWSDRLSPWMQKQQDGQRSVDIFLRLPCIPVYSPSFKEFRHAHGAAVWQKILECRWREKVWSAEKKQQGKDRRRNVDGLVCFVDMQEKEKSRKFHFCGGHGLDD